MEFEDIYQSYRNMVYSVAYRMLGSFSDAEDVVQDVFAALQQLDINSIGNLKAYLVKMATNHCLNTLSSARKKREVYVGPWLPEPEISEPQLNPVEEVVRNESVSYAFLVLLEQLNPVERAVFVLREALAYNYREIAEILDKTEANCRKIYSRCKQKLQNPVSAQPEEPAQMQQIVQTFLDGAKTGSFEPFINLLKADAVLVSDGGGKMRAALFPIYGKERVQAFFEGVFTRGFFDAEFLPAVINGQLGIVGKKDGRLEKVLSFDWDADKKEIKHIYILMNPDKLNNVRSM